VIGYARVNGHISGYGETRPLALIARSYKAILPSQLLLLPRRPSDRLGDNSMLLLCKIYLSIPFLEQLSSFLSFRVANEHEK
jgi:hypothetical protein